MRASFRQPVSQLSVLLAAAETSCWLACRQVWIVVQDRVTSQRCCLSSCWEVLPLLPLPLPLASSASPCRPRLQPRRYGRWSAQQRCSQR